MDGDLNLDRFDSPDALLDLLRAHPDWPEPSREAVLGRLVERFPSERVVATLRRRVEDLDGADAEAVLRLVEAHPDAGLLAALAESVERQEDLRPETAWEALAVLDAVGYLERVPALVERWEELNEALEDGDSIDALVDQIEDDPEGIWLALQGLGAVEPEVRPRIVAGLADVPVGPGLAEFLRLLAHADDPPTREAALSVLESAEADNPDVLAAWRDLASRHADPAVAERARRHAGPELVASTHSRELASVRSGPLDRAAARIQRSLVTAVDGQGRGSIVLAAEGPRGRVTAAFVCDVEQGVREVVGDRALDAEDADEAFEELGSQVERATVEDRHELALGLLAGSLWLRGPGTPPALRYWVESTLGPDFRPGPFRAEFSEWDPATLGPREIAERARVVLDACPDWLDDSPWTFEMAEEIHLREGATPPDPGRDRGAYRILFERRLRGELERYRRMLLWMAWFWQAAGDEELGRSAFALAWQLSDAQHVVPGHPFTVALTTRSLAAAMDAIRSGRAPTRS